MKIKIIAATVTAAVFIMSLAGCGEPQAISAIESESTSEESNESPASNVSESKSEPADELKDEPKLESEENPPLDSESVKEFGMWDVLPEIPLTDVSELEYRLNETGDGIIITDFVTEKTEIRIPDEIEGKPVVGIRLNDVFPNGYIDEGYFSYDEVPGYKQYDITELILPDTIQEIYSPMLAHSYMASAPVLSKVEYMNYPTQLSTCYCVFPSLKALYIDEGRECAEVYYTCGIRFPESLETLYIPDSTRAFTDSYFGENNSIKTIYYNGDEYNGYTDELHHLINNVNGDGLAVIGGTLFGYYSDNEIVVIPDGVDGFNNYPFNFNETIKEVTIPASVKYGFGSDTMDSGSHFNGCTELTSVTFEKGSEITELSYCFKNCTKLKSIALPDNCKYVSGCFENCTELTSVTIPDIIERIDNSFANCPNINEIILGDNVSNTIDLAEAFRASKDNSELKIVYRGEEYSLSEYEEQIFINLKDFKIRRGVLEEYTGTKANVVVPNSVTTLDKFAFYGDENIERVILPDSVTEIGAHSFYDCPNLTYVKLPDDVTFALDTLVHDVSTNTHMVTSYAFLDSPNVEVEYKGKVYDYDHIKDLMAIILDAENNLSISILHN